MLAAVTTFLGTVKDTPSLTLAVLGLILAIGAFAYQTQLVLQVVKENTEMGAVVRAAVVAEALDTRELKNDNKELLKYLKNLDERLRRKGI